MDWLADIVSKLPLDSISEAVSDVTLWWSKLVADVPPDVLPLYAYVGFSCIVLILWLFIVRVLPRPIGGISWLAVFSVLLAPGLTAGETGDIAPASIVVIYGILMKDPGLALRNLLPILVVFTLGLFLGFIWQLIRNIITSSIEKSSVDDSSESLSYQGAYDDGLLTRNTNSADDNQNKVIPKSNKTLLNKKVVDKEANKQTIDKQTVEKQPIESVNAPNKMNSVKDTEAVKVEDPFVKKAASNYAKIVESDDVENRP